MNYDQITISREHWEALYQLEFAVRQGDLMNLTDALDELCRINSRPPIGLQPEYHFGLSTLTACGNVLKIAKEIQDVIGEPNE